FWIVGCVLIGDLKRRSGQFRSGGPKISLRQSAKSFGIARLPLQRRFIGENGLVHLAQIGQRVSNRDESRGGARLKGGRLAIEPKRVREVASGMRGCADTHQRFGTERGGPAVAPAYRERIQTR